jgi:hypothetical protein
MPSASLDHATQTREGAPFLADALWDRQTSTGNLNSSAEIASNFLEQSVSLIEGIVGFSVAHSVFKPLLQIFVYFASR